MHSRPVRGHARSLIARVAATALTATAISLLFVQAHRDSASAASVPAGFTDTRLVSGLSNPTAMAFAPDGRLFVTQQGGQLRVIKNGALLPAPFTTVTVNSTGERGLLGVAFDPNFASNQFVYVYYTATSPAVHNRVSRFTANGDVAAAGSEVVLLELDNLSGATNHNGGALHFGADGKLYVATGDNASGSNAQTLSNLLGKVLRINANGSIPTDNPFYTTATGTNRAIWTLGLRNPFTFDVQTGSGRIFINDVGEGTWEEINDGIAGSNYGWPATEGPTTNPSYRGPIHAYTHSDGCSIAGGSFYNPPVQQFPSEYAGDYFFADYCGGWIRRFDPGSGAVTSFASGIASPVDLKDGPDGSLYYLERGAGAVGKISFSTGQAPSITQHPANQTASVGGAATFTVSASGSQPLTYQWQRNGANIAGATSASYTRSPVQSSDNGATFRAVVTNAQGSATSNSATLTVTSNTPPTGSITSPTTGTLYAAGDTINYSGTASDPQDGTLPPSAFTWTVDFHHDTHTHPFIPATSGATSGSFTIPTSGETSANVWYRVILTVRDSAGATSTTTRDILPRTASVTLATSPSGRQVTLDGQPQTAPFTFTGVVGMRRTIGAPSPQAAGGTTYAFASWSDGGAATHDITTPASTTTYTATFTAGATTTVTFDDLAGQNQPLSGQYPASVIDWGSGAWYHSGPWRGFTTKSVSFNAPGATSAPFNLFGQSRLVQADVFNGGSGSTTVTFRCPGQADKTQSVGANQLTTISTGWTANCATVTIISTNGWDTNFDNLVLASGAAAATPTPPAATATPTPSAATATPTPPAATATATPTRTATPTATVPTGASTALRFDGVDDVATAQDSSSLDVTSSITLEAWVKFDSLRPGAWHTIIFKQGSGSNLAYALYYRDGISFEFASNGANHALNDNRALPTGVWHHIAGVYDGSTMRIFVNGQQTASRTYSGPVNVSTMPLTLGNNSVWSDEQLHGTIDEARVSRVARYSTAFTPAVRLTVDANTAALWHFDEGTGQTCGDAASPSDALLRGPSAAAEGKDPGWAPGR